MYYLLTKLCTESESVCTIENLCEDQLKALWKLAIQHKIGPTIANQISRFSGDLPASLTTQMERHRAQNLRRAFSQCAEIARLSTLFEGNGVRILLFKGLGLSHLLNMDLSERHVGDIDILLVDKEQFEVADQLLNQSGYVRGVLSSRKKLKPGQIRQAILHAKDILYYSEKSNVVIELHLKLTVAITSFPVPSSELYGRRGTISLGSSTIPVMSLIDHQVYVLIHFALCGEVHRLKWVLDIVKVSGNGKYYLDSAAFKNRVFELGLQRTVVEALCVANKELTMPVPDWAVEYYNRSWVVRRFVRRAQNKLINQVTPEDSFFAKLSHSSFYILVYAPLSTAGWRHKLAHFKGYLLNKSDWDIVELPPYLGWMYYILRPFFWVVRKRG